MDSSQSHIASSTLRKFFQSILNSQYKIDYTKFYKLFRAEFAEFADKLWPTVKKLFLGLKSTVTFHDYCKIVQQFISSDHQKSKALLLLILDVNKDGQIDDGDLFESLKMTNSKFGDQLLKNDIRQISKFLEKEREKNGQGDNAELKHKIILQNVEEA